MSHDTSARDVSAGGARKRYPLYLTLAAVFVTLFVVFGLALIGFFHRESKRIELLGADDLMDRIGRHMQTSIAELYLPAQSLVDVASKSAPLAGTSLDDRLATLGVLTEALRLNPHMSSIFVGYEDGEFFLVRSVGDRRVAAQALDAPKGSRFAVQSIERDEGVRGTLLFFDDALELLDTRPLSTTDFDPRDREWYRLAIGGQNQVTSDFYVFFTTGEVGISFARRLARGGGVVGADLALADLSAGLAQQRVTPSTRIAIFDPSKRVIAVSTPELGVPVRGTGSTDRVTMPGLGELDDPVYSALAAHLEKGEDGGRFELDAAGEKWLASVSTVPTRRGGDVFLATLIPRSELLADVDRIRNQSVLMAIALLIIASGIVLAVSRGLSSSLRGLAREAEQIRHFKLGRPMTVRSRIAEVDELANTMGVMKHSLQQFFAISKALSAEKDYKKLLEMILREACAIAHADGGAILMVSDDEAALELAILENEATGRAFRRHQRCEPPFDPVLLDESEAPALEAEASRAKAETMRINDLAEDRRFDHSAIRERYGWKDGASRSLLNVPLTDQKDEIVGVLQLVNARSAAGEVMAFDPEVVPSIEAVAGDAAVALDLRRLLQAQKDLLDAIIHMVAGAIDAKSPYTHGHCQRVPEIAKDLARAAHESRPRGRLPISDSPTTSGTNSHLASWLHDCGKLTTPEYVVDKATRLETITNRLHEIRTRFEVLWRDAEIEYLQSLAEGAAEDAEARDRLERRLDEIRRDYRVHRRVQLGRDLHERRADRTGHRDRRPDLDPPPRRPHRSLARRTRTQAKRTPSPDLPVEETLLADKVEHLVYRDGPPFGDNPHGFKMDVPEHLYNHGEIYNLCVAARDADRRGTLQDQRAHRRDHQHARPAAVPEGAAAGPRVGRQPPREARRHRLPAPARRRRSLGPGADHGRRRYLRGAHRLRPPLQTAQEAQHLAAHHELLPRRAATSAPISSISS